MYDLNIAENPSHPVDDEFQRRIMSMMMAQNTKISDLVAENADLRTELADIQAKLAIFMAEPIQKGIFPPLNEITRMQVQVFHRTSPLTLKEKKGGKTEWSLKIEFWHRHRKSSLNVALISQSKLLELLIKNNAPTTSIEFVETMDANTLCGCVRHVTADGKGRPYHFSQVIAMRNHEDGPDDVVVAIQIADDIAITTRFKPANGTKVGSSLYFGVWSPTNSN